MDAHLFRLFAENAASFFEGALISKIQEPCQGLLTFGLYNRGRKRQFVFRYGKRDPFCFFTDVRLPAAAAPSAHIMRIRKYFGQKRVAAAIFSVWARQLWLMAANQGQEDGKNPWLCLDFARGASLYFLDESELPLPEAPVWPDGDNLGAALEQWRDFPVLTPALRKTLAQLEKLEALALLRDLEAGGGDMFVYSKSSGGPVFKVSAWPLPKNASAGLIEEASADALAFLERAGADLALAPLYRTREAQLEERARKKRRHYEKLLANLQNDERKLRLMAHGGEDANRIKAMLWRLEPDRHLEKLECGDGSFIALDRRFSIAENMRRLFNSAARGKRGLKVLAERRSVLEAEMAAFCGEAQKKDESASAKRESNKISGAVGKLLPKDVAGFRSSDGFLLLRGKNAKGNAAVRRMAAPHDLWAHVEQGQGAHVVIRRDYPGQETPEATLREAGSLAANKSWLAGADQAAVMYAEIRHVKPIRKGGPGNVAIDRLAFTRLVPLDESLESSLALEK